MGLVSPGGVHSHQDHAAGAGASPQQGRRQIVVHAFTDGRDTAAAIRAARTSPRSSPRCPRTRSIATVTGRYFAMDRDKRWDRVAAGLRRHGRRQGRAFRRPGKPRSRRPTPRASPMNSFPASVIGDYAGMQDGDAHPVLQFPRRPGARNPGRPARSRHSTASPAAAVKFAAAAGMTRYSDALAPFMTWLFDAGPSAPTSWARSSPTPARPSLRMAETEKFAHVTYFLNGGAGRSCSTGEDRIMVPSPKVATYDLQPEMSAPELTDRAVEAIDSGKYDLIVLNFANPDMVGHTGSLPAAIKAVETVDAGLGRIAEAVQAPGRRADRHRRPRQL